MVAFTGDTIMQLTGNRKFLVAIVPILLGFVLAMFGKMTGSEYVTLTGLSVGLFGGANAVVHAARARNGKTE